LRIKHVELPESDCGPAGRHRMIGPWKRAARIPAFIRCVGRGAGRADAITVEA